MFIIKEWFPLLGGFPHLSCRKTDVISLPTDSKASGAFFRDKIHFHSHKKK
jgi:hypothetical protein